MPISAIQGGAVLEFSNAYADQNERDYTQLVEAVKSGRIIAQVGL